MSEILKATIRQLNDAVWNQGDVDALDEYYAEGFVRHNPPYPDIVGLKALKVFVADVRDSYPDFHMTIDEIIVEGDTVAARWTWRGTHTAQGKLLPIPPTGKHVTVMGATLARNVDGKTVKEWQFQDWLGLLQQLGLVPSQGEDGG